MSMNNGVSIQAAIDEEFGSIYNMLLAYRGERKDYLKSTGDGNTIEYLQEGCKVTIVFSPLSDDTVKNKFFGKDEDLKQLDADMMQAASGSGFQCEIDALTHRYFDILMNMVFKIVDLADGCPHPTLQSFSTNQNAQSITLDYLIEGFYSITVVISRT